MERQILISGRHIKITLPGHDPVLVMVEFRQYRSPYCMYMSLLGDMWQDLEDDISKMKHPASLRFQEELNDLRLFVFREYLLFWSLIHSNVALIVPEVPAPCSLEYYYRMVEGRLVSQEDLLKWRGLPLPCVSSKR